VKALDQFGTLGGVTATISHACYWVSQSAKSRKIQCYNENQHPGKPTYDLSHAHYESHYVAFVQQDLINYDGVVHRPLSKVEQELFDRYVRVPGVGRWEDAVWQTALNALSGYATTRTFPLLVVGDYFSTGANVAVPGDLGTAGYQSTSTFTAVQDALQQGKPVGSKAIAPAASLVQDFNAEANVITAFICHADGLRPKSVCGRSVIRTILKHIR
jgi:hypothetical protein